MRARCMPWGCGTNLLLPSATVVTERLCFHRCLSVHRGEVYTPWADTLPAHPPSRHHPWTDTPPEQTRPSHRHAPLGRLPHPPRMPGGWVCMPHAGGACVPGGHAWHARPPQTEFLTHACENITFPQLLLRAVIMLYSTQVHPYFNIPFSNK